MLAGTAFQKYLMLRRNLLALQLAKCYLVKKIHGAY